MASRESCQDTERNRPSQAHSPTGDDIERDSSGHRKKPTDRGALTLWRWHREGLVRTQRETDRSRRTHILEMASGGTRQDTERNRPVKAHSHPGDSIGRNSSGHRKKPTEQGALTFWKRHREGLIRTQKETDRARRTHQLEMASRGTRQDTEINRPSQAHSPTGGGIKRDSSGHRKKPTGRGALTLWRRHREGLVRTQKETDRPRHTHFLETASGGTRQDTEKNRPTEAHSLPGDGIGRNSSGHRKKPTEQGALTNWRRHREGLVRRRKRPTEQGSLTSWKWHREGLVRTQKETDRPRCTHILETASGGTRQDTERNRPSEAHSPTGDSIERDSSGHRKKPTDRGTLTSWRRHREGLVGTQKETERARCTHILETASGGTCHDTERNRPAEAHSLPGDGIGRDSSGYRNKPTEQGSLTSWRQHREGLFRTQKEPDRARRTHFLEMASGETCQDAERNRPTEAHSQAQDGRESRG